jgi:hypothetical protein
MFLTINYPKIKLIDSKIFILNYNINPIYLGLTQNFYQSSRLNEVNTSQFITGDKISEYGIRVSSR